jgi:hypothetical protein
VWKAIAGAYELAPRELELLRQACRVTDHLARIDAALMDSDVVVEGYSGQPSVHAPGPHHLGPFSPTSNSRHMDIGFPTDGCGNVMALAITLPLSRVPARNTEDRS